MTECVHHLIEEQARRHGHRTAVIHDDVPLSFGLLNRRANRLAWALRSRGIGRKALVGVLCEFGLELPVALLGVLKAGAAYVPLDPTYPRKRLAAALSQAGCRVLVTQARLAARDLPVDTILTLDEEAGLVCHPDTDPPRVNGPNDPVYCIFTSGSTGEPKGALNLHKGFANLCRWYASPAAAGGAGCSTLVVSSVGFDLTQKNLLEPLASGGRLILAGRRVGELAAIDRAMTRERPSRLNCAPSAFQAMKTLLLRDSVEMIVLGGEPIKSALAEEITGRGITLMNSYGPTECSDVAMFHVESAAVSRSLPLGAPIPNVAIRLLDERLLPLDGPGVAELFIGGAGVGAGYVGRPDLTAERFIADPFGPGRLYRTGDLVRRDEDGTIWYACRADDQVKVRGNRVEITEIEAAIARHPEVAGAAVVKTSRAGAAERLIAFIVPRDPRAPADSGALAAHIAEQLPSYMAPAAWRSCASLPLTASGKVDRLRLWREAEQLVAPPGPASGTDAPCGAAETILLEIWRAAIPGASLGAEDDFFAAGGDSLAALQIAIAVQERWGRPLDLETLDAKRTVRRLAATLGAPLPASQGRGRRHGLPDIIAPSAFRPGLAQGEALAKADRPLASLKDFTFGVRLIGRVDLARLESALSVAAARQEALRTSFAPAPEGGVIGRVARTARPLFDRITLEADEPGDEARLREILLNRLREAPLPPSRAPLMRCILVERGPEEWICGFRLHHAIADAWSMSVLTREIGEAYAGSRGAGRIGDSAVRRFTPALEAEARRLAADGFAEERRYWSQRLQDLPAPFLLPFACAPRGDLGDHAQTLRFALHEGEMAAIRRLCRENGVTVYNVLLAALFRLLRRHGSGQDLYIRSPATARRERGLSDVIGPFGTSIVVRVQPRDETAGGAEFVRAIADQVRQAQRHSGLPPQLLDACMPVAEPGSSGRFPIVYNHHNYPPHPESWGELDLVPLGEDFSRIKGSLALHSWQDGDAVHCAMAANRDLYAAADVERLVRAFREAVGELAGCGLVAA